MTESEYINVYPDPEAKLVQVRTILEAFDTLVVDLVSKGSITEYLLDDGQVRIQRKYSSLKELDSSRLAYEQLANRLLAQIHGRSTKILPCSE